MKPLLILKIVTAIKAVSKFNFLDSCNLQNAFVK